MTDEEYDAQAKTREILISYLNHLLIDHYKGYWSKKGVIDKITHIINLKLVDWEED